MLSELSTLSLGAPRVLPVEHKPAVDKAAIDQDAMAKAAQEFEASYIAQMLTFSGLGKALTTGGGEDMSAFTSFYIQSFAEKIAENGGFGLAEKFYDRMAKISGVSGDVNVEDPRVELGKL